MMTVSRRQTLAVIGGGVIAAAAATSVWAVTRTPSGALQPWQRAGQYEDPRMQALSWAILAPNPHNRQPWMVDLSVEGQVMLHVDTNRLLPHTDPFSRQIVIGLGCFLEVMRMAALDGGQTVSFELFPDGSDPDRLDARPVARCTFEDGAGATDPLFAHVPERRSLKEPYDITRPVPVSALEAMIASARHTTTAGSVAPDTVTELRALSHEALAIEILTEHTYKESVDLFRIGRREIEANPDGIDFSGPMFEALHLTGLFNRDVVMDPASTSFKQGYAAVLENADTAMGFIWQVTQGNTREDQIAAGRDWVRINLAATALGVGTQPLSQALQEYPEMAELYQAVHERLAPDGGTVQMFARLGYGPNVPQSPRWKLESKRLDV